MSKAEAIRAWRNPQYVQEFSGFMMDNDGARCAIGALFNGFSHSETEMSGLADEDYFQEAFDFRAKESYDESPKCPVCLRESMQTYATPLYCGLDAVMHLNDIHEMTFGQIADFAEANPELVFKGG